MEEHQEEAVK